MSKKAKKTIEELLEVALVPEDEQPYKIQENWNWIKFGSVLSIMSGKSLTKKLMNEEGAIPVYGGNGVTGFHSEWNVDEPTIVLGRVGYYCGSVHQTPPKAWVTDNAFIVKFNKDILNERFLFWMLKYYNLKRYSSSSAQPVISGRTLNPSPLVIPPLEEQKRIADKVERLLNKIDEAKQLIDDAKETFELRRAAILDKAFRGELTADWRDGNRIKDTAETLIKSIREKVDNTQIKINTQNIKEVNESDKPFELPNGWKWVRLGQLAYYVTSGSRDWSKYYSDSGAIFIRTQDINTNKLVLDDVAYMNLPENVEGKRSLVEEGDLLTTITGANVGKCAIVEFDITEAYVSQSVALTKLVDKSISKYIYMSLISPNGGGGELKDRAYGIGRPVLSLEDIKNIKIPLAPFNEQQEIIRRIEALLVNEEKAIEYINLETRLDQLKNIVLSKAVRGELGTNDPTEESAIELLKEVLQEHVK